MAEHIETPHCTSSKEALLLKLTVQSEEKKDKFRATVASKFNCAPSLLQTDCVQWSTDNRASVITSKGIFVLSVSHKGAKNETTAIHKFFIENPKQTFTAAIHASVREMMHKLEGEDEHKVILDHSLLPETANDAQFRVFRLAIWSPVTRKYGCILATLTVDHRLQLFIEKNNEWIVLIDLSRIVYDHIAGVNNIGVQLEECRKNPSYSSLRDIFYKTMLHLITWTHMHTIDGKEVCFLICVSKNGYFTFFKLAIEEQSDFTNDDFELVSDWDSGLGLITCLTWFQNYLIIGTNGGQLQVIRPSINFKSDCVINVSMAARVNPWIEKDNISINNLVVSSINSNSFWVAFTKGLFIIVSRINEISVARKPILCLDLRTTKEAIYKMPSSAMCLTSANTFLISSLDGRLLSVKVSNDCTIKQKELKIDSISFNNRCIFGLNSSQNSAIVCMAQTLVTYHDHLTIPEPTQIILFSSQSFDKVIKRLTKLLNNNNFQSVKSVADILHSFAYYLQSGHFWFPPQLQSMEALHDFFVRDQTNSFKLLRFIALILKRNCSYFIGDKLASLETMIELIEDQITRKHVEYIFNGVLHLNQFQKQSLLNFNCWLDMRFGQRVTMNLPLTKEKCPICGTEVEFNSRTVAVCPSNHKFGRCSSSLLLCDLMKNKSLNCNLCNVCFYITPAIWKQCRDCLYCG